MKKIVPAANPDVYVAGLDGWRRDSVVVLRKAVKAAARLDEGIKWGHLVYSSQGPVLLIRAASTENAESIRLRFLRARPKLAP